MVWGTIFEHCGCPGEARKLFLLKTNLLETNYSKPLRQPQVDPAYRVYLKHRNSILKFYSNRSAHSASRRMIGRGGFLLGYVKVKKAKVLAGVYVNQNMVDSNGGSFSFDRHRNAYRNRHRSV